MSALLSNRKGPDLGLVVLRIFVTAFFLFLLAPILIVVLYSLSDAAYTVWPIQDISLRWYERMIEYTPFLTSLAFSFKVAIWAAVLSILIGVPAALALARSRARWAEAVTTFLLAPLSMPMILLGVALLYYFSWMGLGVSQTSVILSHTVVSLPYIVRTVAAVYMNAGKGQEESASILGANKVQVFLRVTLPMIRAGILAGGIFAMLISLDNLPISFFFAGPDTNTLPVVMLAYQQNQFDPAIAAISTTQMVIVIVMLLVVQRLTGLHHIIGQQR